MRRTQSPGVSSPRLIDKDYLIADNSFLRSKNKELAKEMSVVRNTVSQLDQDRMYLQRENMNLTFQNRLVMTRLRKVTESIKDCMKLALRFTEDIAFTYNDLVSIFQDIENESFHNEPPRDPAPAPSTSSNNISVRTQAVKPMISGHVIHRPTINLRRLPPEQLQRMANSNLQNTNETSPTSPPASARVPEIFVSSPNVSEGEQVNNEPRELNTLNEDDEANQNSTIDIHTVANSSPLLTGVFNDVDVRVYMTPLQDMPALQPNIARQLSVRKRRIRNTPSPSNSSEDTVEENNELEVGGSGDTSMASVDFHKRMFRRLSRVSRPPTVSPFKVTKRRRVAVAQSETPSSNETHSSRRASTLENNCGSTRGNSDDFNTPNRQTIVHEDDSFQNKVFQMNLLGLSPVASTSTPISPRRNLRSTRRSRLNLSDASPNVKRNKQTPKMPNCTVVVTRMKIGKFMKRTSSSRPAVPKHRSPSAPASQRSSSSSSSHRSSSSGEDTSVQETKKAKMLAKRKQKTMPAPPATTNNEDKNETTASASVLIESSPSPKKRRGRPRATAPKNLCELPINRKMRREV